MNKSFQLDHWITNSLSIIKDAKAIDYGVPSNNSAIILILKFSKEKKEERKPTTNIDWNMFIEEDTKLAFNKFLKENLKKYNFTSNKNKISYTIFSDILMKSARGMLPLDNIDSPGWFNFSRDILQLLIDKRTEILNRIRQIDLDPKLAKHLASSARRDVNDGIVLAKQRWTHFLAEKNHKLSDSPKKSLEICEYIKRLDTWSS